MAFYVHHYLQALWDLTVELAPWLLLGLIAAGVVRAVLPMAWVARVLGRPGPAASVYAAVLGAPLPLCSCSVMPVAVSLRRQGASKGATASFLVSTPQNGIDSISVSYALLGPFLTVARPVAGIISATLVGWLIALADRETPAPLAPPSKDGSCVSLSVAAAGDSCCEPAPVEAASCCEASPAEKSQDASKQPRLTTRLIDGVRYAMTTLLGDLLLWLILGLLAAAAVKALLPVDVLGQYGSGLGAMMAALLIGIPMYICATSSTPLAAALLMAGVSPGTVLVFLLAGPATNLGTFGVVRRELGGRSAWLFVGGMSVAALGLGLATDAVASWMHITPAAQVMNDHEMLPAWIGIVCFAVLVVATILTTYTRWNARRTGDVKASADTCCGSVQDAASA